MPDDFDFHDDNTKGTLRIYYPVDVYVVEIYP